MAKPNYSKLPDYAPIPREHREKAKAERDRRKACHGNWYAHSATCEQTDERNSDG